MLDLYLKNNPLECQNWKAFRHAITLPKKDKTAALGNSRKGFFFTEKSTRGGGGSLLIHVFSKKIICCQCCFNLVSDLWFKINIFCLNNTACLLTKISRWKSSTLRLCLGLTTVDTLSHSWWKNISHLYLYVKRMGKVY